MLQVLATNQNLTGWQTKILFMAAYYLALCGLFWALGSESLGESQFLKAVSVVILLVCGVLEYGNAPLYYPHDRSG